MDDDRQEGERSTAPAAARYVLVTAAYDEAEHIGRTLGSVVAQTVRPVVWSIVSDGSTDGTDEIVRDHAARHAFIRFLRVEKDAEHCFASKVAALERAQEALLGIDYDFLGVLDADVSFDARYFEELLDRFHSDPRLGVAGGHIVQWIDGREERRVKDPRSVAGAVQFFRRGCFEQAGGLPPLRHGGEDAAVEIAARMHGWGVRTVPELRVTHHGLVGSGAGSRLQARFKWGQMNFSLGYHPLFELARCAFRVIEPPYLIGSAAEMAGFLAGRLRYRRPQVSGEVVAYLRQEQIRELQARLWLRRRR